MEFKDAIIEEAKARGMDVAEDAVITLIDILEHGYIRFALSTDDKKDDFGIPVVSAVATVLREKADVINGKEG